MLNVELSAKADVELSNFELGIQNSRGNNRTQNSKLKIQKNSKLKMRVAHNSKLKIQKTQNSNYGNQS